MKPARIVLLLILLILLALIFTNPSLHKHQEAVTAEARIKLLAVNPATTDSSVVQSIQRDNYFLFSWSKISVSGTDTKLGFGILGKVYLLNQDSLKVAVQPNTPSVPDSSQTTSQVQPTTETKKTEPATTTIKKSDSASRLKPDTLAKSAEAHRAIIDSSKAAISAPSKIAAKGVKPVTAAVMKEVKIGSGTWMGENLNISYFRNGDPIAEAKTNDEWIKAGEDGTPAWCYYENDPSNGTKYGRLYNWFAVHDPRGLAPQGWRMPTQADWSNALDVLGGETVAGTKMKAEKGWEKYSNGNNSSGFVALPGGFRLWSGSFKGAFGWGFWWTNTEGSDKLAWERYLNYGNSSVEAQENKRAGLSVRCIKN